MARRAATPVQKSLAALEKVRAEHDAAVAAHHDAREAGVTGPALDRIVKKRETARAKLDVQQKSHDKVVKSEVLESDVKDSTSPFTRLRGGDSSPRTVDESATAGSPITETTAVSNPCPTCRKEAVPARMVSVKNGPRSNKTTAVCRDCATLGSDIKTIGAAHQERQERIASQPKPETSNVTEEQMRGLLGSEAELSVRTASRTPHDLQGVLPAGLPSGVGAMAVGLDAGAVPRTQAEVRGLGATPNSVQQLADQAIEHAQTRSTFNPASEEYAKAHSSYQEAHARLTRVAPKVADLVNGVAMSHQFMTNMIAKHQRDPSSATPERLAQIQTHKRNIRQGISLIKKTIATQAGVMGEQNKGVLSTDALSRIVGDTSALVTGGRVIEGTVPRRERTDLPERPIREAKQPPRQPR
jgi:hypothetical protein